LFQHIIHHFSIIYNKYAPKTYYKKERIEMARVSNNGVCDFFQISEEMIKKLINYREEI